MLADKNSGLQMHFLGQLKRHNGQMRFQIATSDNGFITPLDAELFDLISDLADKTLGNGYSEDDLSNDLKTRLKLG